MRLGLTVLLAALLTERDVELRSQTPMKHRHPLRNGQQLCIHLIELVKVGQHILVWMLFSTTSASWRVAALDEA